MATSSLQIGDTSVTVLDTNLGQPKLDDLVRLFKSSTFGLALGLRKPFIKRNTKLPVAWYLCQMECQRSRYMF